MTDKGGGNKLHERVLLMEMEDRVTGKKVESSRVRRLLAVLAVAPTPGRCPASRDSPAASGPPLPP